MRILAASTAGDGHLGPLFTVAGACLRAGHEVIFTAPDRVRDKIEKRGFAFRPFTDSDPAARGALFAQTEQLDMQAGNVIVVRDVFGRLNAGTAFESVRALMHDLAPDLVLREPFEGASWLASVDAGVPSVMVPCATWRTMPFASRYLFEGLRELVAREGLGVTPDVSQGCSAIATQTPASLENGDLPSCPIVRVAPDPPAAPYRGACAPPRVFVCFGTVAGVVPRVLGRIGTAVCEALSDLDVEVDFAVGRGVDPAPLGTVPDNVRVRDFVPFDEVLPTASAVIMHGGYGTTLGTLAAGVPSLVVPLFSFDQWDNAAAVAEAGAGVTLDAPEQTADDIRAAVSRVLDDAVMRRRAREIAGEMREQLTPAALSAELERVARDRSR